MNILIWHVHGAWTTAFVQGKHRYLIPVDEFAEVELRGNRVLTRSELRGVCDARKSKEAIVSALER